MDVAYDMLYSEIGDVIGHLNLFDMGFGMAGRAQNSEIPSAGYASFDGHDTHGLNDKKEQEDCKCCKNLKAALQSSDYDREALLKTKDVLAEELKDWGRKYGSLQKRSDEITSQMAGVLEISGNLENVNDTFANTKLSKRFGNLYDIQWIDLSECLQTNTDNMKEVEQIKILTNLMKLSYKKCLETAENQLHQFLFLDKNDSLPSQHEDPELFKIRRKIGQKTTTRAKLVKKILQAVQSGEDAKHILVNDTNNEVKDKLENFFKEFIDICWLMTISHPRLILNFDVIGEPYCGIMKEKFKQYSCQDTITNETMSKGDIYEVVWPSVELENCEGICAKGDVITVEVGKDMENTTNT